MKEEKFIEPTLKDVREICRKYELGRGGPRLSCGDATMYNDRNMDNGRIRRRRIKICTALDHLAMSQLQRTLQDMFPAHTIAVGPYLSSSEYSGATWRYTTIQIVLNKEKYRELYPTKRVKLTIDEIAQLAGCRSDEVTIVK
jgi:hypothetical protein